MKRSHKSSILIISLLIAITVLRETGVISLDYYSFTSNINSEANWSAHTTAFDATLPKGESATKQERLADAPIEVFSKGERIYYKPGKGSPVKIYLNGFDTGFMWVPLYKSSHLHITANVHYAVNIWKTKGIVVDNAPGLKSISGSINSNISLDGDVAIKGLCSRRKAREIIGRRVTEQFADKIENYFSALDYWECILQGYKAQFSLAVEA